MCASTSATQSPEPAGQISFTPSGQPLFEWLKARSSGVLMHPTSLPGAFGIGALDENVVEAWLNFLSTSGFQYWQICPLGPTGYGDSPYQCFSAFAGNPYLIDVAALQRFGLLTDEDILPLRALPQDKIDFGWLYVTKWPVLFRAFANFKKNPAVQLPYGDFAEFRKEHADWLDSYSVFLALKDHHQGKPWWEWPDTLRFYTRALKAKLPAEVNERAEAHAFFQYLFFGQWAAVRARAEKHGIQIIGDAPIFVARDSADVWGNPEMFRLDPNTGHPLVVAGVPPDYFSADGQLWGNPLYDWEKHSKDNYRWWLRRLQANFQMCDVLRIDHFRAFDSYWAIPANAVSAKTGVWEQGPGLDFFNALHKAMPGAKLIAEDLGELNPSVRVLRRDTGLPGMTILQFAFGSGSDNLYLPHNLAANSVVYPGTHDNDTTLGWYRAATEGERDHVRRYFRVSGEEVNWDFIRAGYAAVSGLAVFAFQDLLGLGSEARFNSPGKAVGNWQWRYRGEQLEHVMRQNAMYLRTLGDLYGRLAESKQPQR